MNATSNNRSRKGQVLVVFISAVIILCLIASLTIDVGSLFVSRARLQNTADAAAKAALLELWEQRASGAAEAEARQAALAEAAAVANMNFPEAGTQTLFGVWVGGQFTPCDSNIPANAVMVRVFRNENAPGGAEPTFFAGFLGLATVDITAFATAKLQPATLTPFAVWEEELAPVGQAMVMYNDKQVAPGAFGLLDYDGGENSANDAKHWTRYGYPGVFGIDPATGSLIVEGCTGLKSSLASSINYHISEGDEIVVCIYRSIWGQAAATQFEVVGFASVVVTNLGWADPSEEELDNVVCQVVGTYFPGTGDTEGPMRDFMRSQLVQ